MLYNARMNTIPEHSDFHEAAATLVAQKKALRNAVLARRDAMSDDARSRASQEICTQLEQTLASLGFDQPTIAVYSPMGSEVDVLPFVHSAYQAGATIVFPCMNLRGEAPRMYMRKVSREAWEADGAPFVVKPIKRFALDDAELVGFPVIEPQSIDVIIVPMVAFDAANNRLGYGGGNYDEYLGLLGGRTAVIGVAFNAQRVQAVPTEPHDKPLPQIISA